MNFHRESVESVQEDIKELITLHFNEVAKYKDLALQPKFSIYRALEASNNLRVYTVRSDSGELIGYSVFIVSLNRHFEGLSSSEDVLFLHPEQRGRGMEFMKWVDEQLSSEGIEVIYRSVTTEFDFSSILERMGYLKSSVIYSKRVKLDG